MNAPPLLQVIGLSGGYDGIPIIRDVSLDVGAGEVLGILGHNGMGKTTLLKHVMGLLPATSGHVHFQGRDITDAPPDKRGLDGMGYVPQGRGLFPELTAAEHLQFAAGYLNDGHKIALRIEEIFDIFPKLREVKDRKADLLSGGEKQLVALGRCLAADPFLMLLDEPTEGVQPSINAEIARCLRALCDRNGMSILLVEQNLDFLLKVSDRILLMDRGTIIEEMPACAVNRERIAALLVGEGGSAASGHMQNPPSPSQTQPPPSQPPAKTKPGTKPTPPTEAPQKGANPMSIKRPQLQDMRDMAAAMGMHMDDRELMDFLAVMEPNFDAYDIVHRQPDNLPVTAYPRTGGVRPTQEENPLNAWYVKTDIAGAATGPLKGKRIALKDTVCVAGVPMMNGASVLEGYVPDLDATIVTRLLDAGANIAGKATCEYLCLSAGSHTSSTGPVHNPWKMGYMAGGSSSGSAALVAAGDVDMAIAGDQGGSIRIPSCNCGVYGMKATHGLVPYSGVFPIEQTIDHVGPVTNNVADNALMLEVLAGSDGLDPRQINPRVDAYREGLGGGVRGMKIGILREAFGRPESESDVDAAVRAGAETFARLGAEVSETSIPDHLLAPAVWTPIAVEGLQDLMMHGNANGTNYRGLFVPGLADYFAGWRARADELSDTLKVCMFLGEYYQTRHRGKYYAKAQNISRRISASYEAVFGNYDLLLMPTLPMKAQQIPPPDAPLSLYVQRGFENIGNTAPFNLTGHPAMTLPCALREGLPVGLQLVGSFWQEKKIYRAAAAFEAAHDWQNA